MARNNKEQKPAESGSINDLKEGDFLDPDLGLDPDLTAGAGVDPAAGADAAAGADPVAGADAAAGADPVAGADAAAGADPAAGADAAAGADPAADADAAAGADPAADADADPAGYIAVVVTGATLKFNGKPYSHSQTVKLPLKTAERLTAIGLVKPLSVVRQELEAKARVGLSITADAGGVEFITGEGVNP